MVTSFFLYNFVVRKYYNISMRPASQKIDLDQIVRARFGKKVPQFFINFMKKMIHQDYINGFFKEGYEGMEFCEKALDYLGVKVEVKGQENIPKGEILTFASNHPLGAIDGIALSWIIGREYDGNIGLLVNDFLMNLKGLAPLCIPVNKVGGQVRNLPILVDELFLSDKQIIMFPAGLVSRLIKGKVQDLPWSKTFIQKSIKSKRNIVPIRFIGENSRRFYRLDKIRKFFKIKFNIAMLFLPDEMYKSRGKTYKIIIGKPIPYTYFDSSKSALEWADYVRSKVYELE